MTDKRIKVGDVIILQKQNYKKLHKLNKPNSVVTLGRDNVNLSGIEGRSYFSSFKLVPSSKRGREFRLELVKEVVALKDEIDIKTSGTDNRNIVDDGRSQKLTHSEITELANDAEKASNIVETLISNSNTFHNKTQFSQQKYLRKKEKKYSEYIQILKPNLRLITEIMYRLDANKIQNLRIDTLSQMITMSNVQSEGVHLLYDSGSNGLVAAALLSAIGEKTEGTLVNMHPGNMYQKQAIQAMNFTAEHLNRCVSVNIYSVLRQIYQGCDTNTAKLGKDAENAEMSIDNTEQVTQNTEIAEKSIGITEKGVEYTEKATEENAENGIGITEKRVENTEKVTKENAENRIGITEKGVENTEKVTEENSEINIGITEKSIENTENVTEENSEKSIGIKKGAENTEKASEENSEISIGITENGVENTEKNTEENAEKNIGITEKGVEYSEKGTENSEKSIENTEKVTQDTEIGTENAETGIQIIKKVVKSNKNSTVDTKSGIDKDKGTESANETLTTDNNELNSNGINDENPLKRKAEEEVDNCCKVQKQDDSNRNVDGANNCNDNDKSTSDDMRVEPDSTTFISLAAKSKVDSDSAPDLPPPLLPPPKKPKWHFDNIKAAKLLTNKVDSLIIACKESPLNIFNELMKFVKPGRPFVVYYPVAEPLQHMYVELKCNPHVIALKLTCNWMRNYQVLPDRTHPEVTMNSQSGFLLTGYIISN